MTPDQCEGLRTALNHIGARRKQGQGPLLPWWRQWATRPQGAPFAPMGDLALTAEEATGTGEGPAFLASAHALAIATWPESLPPFAVPSWYGLGPAMARAINIRRWNRDLAESHLRRILTEHPGPEPVLAAVTHTVRFLWGRGVAVDLAGTAALTAPMLDEDPERVGQGRLDFARHVHKALHPEHAHA